MFEIIPSLIAIVALIFARKSFNEIDALRARLAALESGALQPRPAPVPPPLPSSQAFAPNPATPPPLPAEPPPTVADPVAPIAGSPGIAPSPADGGAAPTPPPLPQPVAAPSFEERIGTRWVVWVGGLTLALGGFFMVRYTIEAGLVGPGVRVLLGGAFAPALLLAGEWLRRKQDPTAIDALPIA